MTQNGSRKLRTRAQTNSRMNSSDQKLVKEVTVFVLSQIICKRAAKEMKEHCESGADPNLYIDFNVPAVKYI
jgi:hypothetical protein